MLIYSFFLRDFITHFTKFGFHGCHPYKTLVLTISFSDGTSASLLEAMACSITPIVTAIPGNKEWIQDGWNGYLTPTRDANQLAQKIIFLVKNEEVRRKMAKNAFEAVRVKVNWQRNVATLNDTIRDMISQKS